MTHPRIYMVVRVLEQFPVREDVSLPKKDSLLATSLHGVWVTKYNAGIR